MHSVKRATVHLLSTREEWANRKMKMLSIALGERAAATAAAAAAAPKRKIYGAT